MSLMSIGRLIMIPLSFDFFFFFFFKFLVEAYAFFLSAILLCFTLLSTAIRHVQVFGILEYIFHTTIIWFF